MYRYLSGCVVTAEEELHSVQVQRYLRAEFRKSLIGEAVVQDHGYEQMDDVCIISVRVRAVMCTTLMILRVGKLHLDALGREEGTEVSVVLQSGACQWCESAKASLHCRYAPLFAILLSYSLLT